MYILTNFTELKAFKVIVFLILGLTSLLRANGQSFPSNQNDIDSLQQLLVSMPDDSARVLTLIKLSDIYTNLDPDKGLTYGYEALTASKKINYHEGILYSLSTLSFKYNITGEWAKGIEIAYQGLEYLKENPSPKWTFSFTNLLNVGYEKQGDYKKCLQSSLNNLKYMKANADKIIDPINIWASYQSVGHMYANLGMPNSALYYLDKGLEYIYQYEVSPQFPAYIFGYKGQVYADLGNYDSAFYYLYKKTDIMLSTNNQFAYQESMNELAKVFYKISSLDSAKKYALIAYNQASGINNPLVVRDASFILADLYENTNLSLAHFYLKKHQRIKDSLTTLDKTNQLYQLEKNELLKTEIIEKERITNTARLRQNTLIGGLGTLSLFSLALGFYIRQKQKSNKKLEIAHSDLQSAQAQLIQSEKMASLGELTAGIAHEIQNPLNFVNNFSELNNELVTELNDELAIGNEQLAKDNKQDVLLKIRSAMDIAKDLKENSEKINHHGKRAESIVKGMLEHSRKSSGVKEPTDINKLCDEFVRLSYHACLSGRQGLRARDKNLPTGQAGFNCDYKLDLDPNLPFVTVVSQDIGRVILNIVNNAFQACFQQSESLKSESQELYTPLVTLKTRLNIEVKNAVPVSLCEISIADNGPGIPAHIKDKIFQPFFTTKPTGQGTGLGLSLAYDIVKVHGGTIEVKSRKEEGTEFGIQIPII